MKKVLIFLAVFIISKTIFPQIIFGEQQLITHPADDARSVFAIDLDSNGDNDVLSASWSDSKIAWYKNVTSSVFIENFIDDNNIVIFPNPAKKTVNVSYDYDFILEICDLSGKALITTTKNTIDISKLSKGIYIVLIKNKEGILQKTDKLVVD